MRQPADENVLAACTLGKKLKNKTKKREEFQCKFSRRTIPIPMSDVLV